MEYESDLEKLTGMPKEQLGELMSEEQIKELEESLAAREQMLSGICEAIKEKRDEAIDARIASGIENDWDEDEDAYEGVDEHGSKLAELKPAISGDSVILPDDEGPEFGSRVIMNITAPYVDAAAAKITDMMLPADDFPFGLKSSPIPDLASDLAGMVVDQQGHTAQQFVEEERAKAKELAEKAETRIRDWLTDDRWHDKVRKTVEHAARVGTGVLKGPIPCKRRRQTFVNGQMVVVEEIVPGSKAVNPRNIFPDGACGENIHDGSFIFERDTISKRQLRDLKGNPGYLADQIDRCLAEGPQNRVVEQPRTDGADQISNDFDLYEVWYYHGQMSRDDLITAGVEDLPDGDVVPAVATMVNDRLIKAHVSHLESGAFPYDFYVWKRRSGMPWGSGVGRAINTPQRMLNNGVQEILDNAALTSAPQIVMKKGSVYPADGVWEITPRKLWYLDGEEMAKVEEVFKAFNIPTMQQQLMNVIEFALRMAEQMAGLPMLLQGQLGASPDTAKGTAIVNENAHTVLRRLARNMDHMLTEPHIQRYHEYLLLYGEDEEKGDLVVDAQGSSALVEREIQNESIMQMGQIVMNPQLRADFRIDPAKWFAEMSKAQRLDPKRFQYEEDDPEAPQHNPAEMQMQMQQMQEEMQKLQEENQKLQIRAAGHEVRAQAQLQTKQMDAESRMMAEQLRGQRAEQLEHIRGQYRKELEGLKAQLAAVDKEINAQKLELDRGKLELQREALRHQIARAEADMAEKMREFDTQTEMQSRQAEQAAQAASNPITKGPTGPGSGSLAGVIKRDDYGMIPDATG